MSSERKFYHHIITLDVVSETPINDRNLSSIVRDMVVGDLSGNWQLTSVEIDGATAVNILLAHGSDTEFFRLDEDGNDLDDESDGDEDGDD
jgi:hypothetical protein